MVDSELISSGPVALPEKVESKTFVQKTSQILSKISCLSQEVSRDQRGCVVRFILLPVDQEQQARLASNTIEIYRTRELDNYCLIVSGWLAINLWQRPREVERLI